MTSKTLRRWLIAALVLMTVLLAAEPTSASICVYDRLVTDSIVTCL